MPRNVEARTAQRANAYAGGEGEINGCLPPAAREPRMQCNSVQNEAKAVGGGVEVGQWGGGCVAGCVAQVCMDSAAQSQSWTTMAE